MGKETKSGNNCWRAEDHMHSPAIVVPGDYKVNWQVCAKDASESDSYTLTVGAEMFNDTIALASWQSCELLFSVAEGDTVRLVKVSTSPRINLSACPASVHLLRIISTDGVATQRVIIRK